MRRFDLIFDDLIWVDPTIKFDRAGRIYSWVDPNQIRRIYLIQTSNFSNDLIRRMKRSTFEPGLRRTVFWLGIPNSGIGKALCVRRLPNVLNKASVDKTNFGQKCWSNTK